jgi:hypothetical protein
LLVAQSLPDRRRDLGQKLALEYPAGSAPDLVDLDLVFSEAGYIVRLATLHKIVDRKLCAIVFDIWISHHFTPLKNGIDTGKPFA